MRRINKRKFLNVRVMACIATLTLVCGAAISDNLITFVSGWADTTHLIDITQAPNAKCVGCIGSPIPAGATLIDTSSDGNFVLFSSMDTNVIQGEQSLPTVNNLYWMDISNGPENPVIRLVTHFAGSTTASAGYFGIGNGLLPETFEPNSADLSADGQTVVFDSRINAHSYDDSVPVQNDMPSVERDLYGELINDNATSDVFVWHAKGTDPARNIACVDLLNSTGKQVALGIKQSLNAIFSSDVVESPDITKPVPIGVFVTTPRYLSLRDLVERELYDPILGFLEIITEVAANQGISADGRTVLYQSDIPAQWIDRKNQEILDDDILAIQMTVPMYSMLKMSLDGFVVRDASLSSASILDATDLTQTVTVDIDGNAQGHFNYLEWIRQITQLFPQFPPMFYEAEFLQLSSDGNRVAYSSRQIANRLVTGVTDSDFSQDVFVFDIALGKNILVSRKLDDPLTTAGSTQETLMNFINSWIAGQTYAYELMDSANLSISENGSTIAIQSSAKDLITGFIDNNVEMRPAALRWNSYSNAFFEYFGPLDLYSVKLASGVAPTSKSFLINSPNGVANTNLNATLYGTSSDGNVAYFETMGNNFYKVPFNDPNYNPTFAAGLLDENFVLGGFNNMWKRVLDKGAIKLVTQGYDDSKEGGNHALTAANKASLPTPTLPGSRELLPNVTDSGRYVLFNNPSNNFVDGINDPNFKGGVYLRDTDNDISVLMSTKATGNAPSIGNFLQTSMGSMNDLSGLVRVFMGGSNGEDMQTQYSSDQIDNGLTPHFYMEDYPRLVKASAGQNPALVSVSGENYNNSIIDFKLGRLTIKASPTPKFRGKNKGGPNVAMGDFNGDGVVDYIYGTPPHHLPEVIVIDGQTGAELIHLELSEEAYSKSGVFVAAGDVDLDGYADVAASYGNGLNKGAIEVYSGRRGFNLLKQPLDGVGTGNNAIAMGNVLGGMTPEILVGSGLKLSSTGVKNHVNVYTIQSNPSWDPKANDYTNEPYLATLGTRVTAAAPNALHGGVYVASADMDGDGYDEIVTGSAIRGEIAVYNSGNSTQDPYGLMISQLLNDIAGDKAYVRGARVAARPGQVITGSGQSGAEVRIYSVSRLRDRAGGKASTQNPILQSFKPSKRHRWGNGNPVSGLNVG